MDVKKTTAENGIIKKDKNLSTKGLDIIITAVITLVFFLSPLFFTGLAGQGLGFEKNAAILLPGTARLGCLGDQGSNSRRIEVD